MKTGTKSLLFGVHQFAWHPITVWRAWRELYGKRPDFWETVAIIVHDWGYWGCDNMDDAEGEQHPIVGARIIHWLYLRTHPGCVRTLLQYFSVVAKGWTLYHLVRYHSRYLAAKEQIQPTPLCWADKLSMRFDPSWFYLLRGKLSGEIKQYRISARHKVSLSLPDSAWLKWCKQKCIIDAQDKRLAKPRNFDNDQPE
jgi:hypothetical protein